jgi:hypothetical protein
MAHKETEFSLRSTKWTTMMDVPARHLIVENFDVALCSDFELVDLTSLNS